MQVIHGTWIPDTEDQFIQRGAFYLWVETDTLQGTSRRHNTMFHPKHLGGTALAAFLMEKLGLRESVPGTLVHTLHKKYLLLPTSANKPLPSFEMRRSSGFFSPPGQSTDR